MPAHIEFAREIKSGNAQYSMNFLYYLTLNLLTFSFLGVKLYYVVAVIVLTISNFCKYYISKKFIYSELEKLKSPPSEYMLIILTMALFFCFSIPDFYNVFVLKKLYLGRAVPFVLHNSTTIFVFPFVLLLFIKQLEFERNTSIRLIVIVSLLIFFNAIAKPSFLIAYLPVTGLLILYSLTKKNIAFNQFWKLCTPLAIGGILIVLEIILIYYYQIDGTGTSYKEKSGVGFSLLHVIAHFLPAWYVPIAFVFSFAFPISLALSYKDIWKYRPFVYSVFLMLFGYFIFLTLYETGPRQYHGNFGWQVMLCTYLVFMTSVIFFYSKYCKYGFTIKNKILAILLSLHVLSGVGYIAKFLITRSYY